MCGMFEKGGKREMTKDEYAKEKERLANAHYNSVRELNKEYAFSNSRYKIGDIFRDHMGRIRIEEIRVGFSFTSGTPSCLFWGVETKVNGDPYKSGSKREAWQSNEVK
jgi:hypothetical protein